MESLLCCNVIFGFTSIADVISYILFDYNTNSHRESIVFNMNCLKKVEQAI